MGRIREGCAPSVVVGQDGGEQIGRRGSHAVEQREIPVAVAEEPQHRHHAVDGVEQRQRRGEGGGGGGGGEGQGGGQQAHERPPDGGGGGRRRAGPPPPP